MGKKKGCEVRKGSQQCTVSFLHGGNGLSMGSAYNEQTIINYLLEQQLSGLD